ncbi:Ubiquitin-associated and SH3 domain-containing protein [Trichinella spiralis]|uniref:Ubiquitin-associated and SH3 domain-containing protein n=1 Tax=Trichinella spiralis TaxID=6334 RepID=A0ABR3K7Z7_TRISP
MSKSNSRTFNTLSFCWEPGIRMQFIFVEENDFPFLNVRAETNQASDGKSPHSTETEGTSQAQASYNARLCDACEVICAPSVSCLIVADNFINGLQKCLKDEMIDLKIKIEGGFSKTVEGYYLYKQFRSLVVGHGYNVDETYESSLQSPENSKIDPYINLVWRVNMTFLSLQNKYSSSEYKMVVVFVDKCLESVLKNAYFMPLAPLEPRISPVGDPSLDAEKKEE